MKGHIDRIFFVIPKDEEYRSEIFKIAGFAMMAPIGKFFLEPWVIFKEINIIKFVIFLAVSSFLAYAGLIFIMKGYDILLANRRK